MVDHVRGQRISGAQVFPFENLKVRRPPFSVAVTVAGFDRLLSLHEPIHVMVAPERATSRKVQAISSVVSDFAPMRTSPAIGDAHPL